jgi:hypothetical protein
MATVHDKLPAHQAQKAGLSQSQFAKRPHQSRAAARRRAGPHHADSAFLAYIRVINREPEAVERALNAA